VNFSNCCSPTRLNIFWEWSRRIRSESEHVTIMGPLLFLGMLKCWTMRQEECSRKITSACVERVWRVKQGTAQHQWCGLALAPFRWCRLVDHCHRWQQECDCGNRTRVSVLAAGYIAGAAQLLSVHLMVVIFVVAYYQLEDLCQSPSSLVSFSWFA
jgi:hypothetical protein